MGSVVVTHPFHPLRGQRLGVVFQQRSRQGLVFVCEVEDQGQSRRVPLPQDWTDRGVPAETDRLSSDSLTTLRGLIDSVETKRLAVAPDKIDSACRSDHSVAESE